MSLTPEVLVPKLGEALFNEGLLTREQLNLALAEQVKRKAENKHQPLGTILVEMGFLSKATLDHAITRQIISLQHALKDSNEQLEKRVVGRTLELEQANKQLSEINRIKGEFIATISHELRTPLTHIKGYLDLFLSEQTSEIPQAVLDGMLVMQRSATRLHKLVDDLIMFSESATGQMELLKTEFDLMPILDIVLERNKELASRKKISLTANFHTPPFNIRADKKRIAWVINQLVENALKFTPENGRVTVTVSKKDLAISLRVEDTGIGFDQKLINEIFEPFRQLDGSNKREQGGIGLGLALVKNILDAHDSNLIVSSSPGLGSVFEFVLPAASNMD